MSVSAQNAGTQGQKASKDTLFKKGRLDTLMRQNGTAIMIDSAAVYLNSFGSHFDMKKEDQIPFTTLQQTLKGNMAGLYVQEPSGEPGTKQWMYIHGLTQPLLSMSNVYDAQPAVYLNGIPLISDNAFNYELQRYDFNPIGPATNLYSIINNSNVESIEVLKDPATLAKLGPQAVNGAVWITTKQATSGKRRISVNSYFGIATKPNVTPINALWENEFRSRFYDKYATTTQKTQYPAFLRDSSDVNYYGPADWVDYYYKNSPFHSVDASLTGGSDRANFRVDLNNTRSVGVSDGTYLDRYGISFFINMAPLKWFSVSAMINGNRLQRKRNKNVRDRLAETGYLPDLTNPLPPNSSIYNDVYLKYFDQAIDNNQNNSVQGYVSGNINLGAFKLQSKIAYDYNEGIRDLFWPTTLMESNNYLSNYYNYNLRLNFSNVATYNLKLSNGDQLDFELGQSFQKDRYKYDYIYGYNTLNDYIKIYKYTTSTAYTGMQPYMFRYTDKIRFALATLHGRVGYHLLQNTLNIGALLRNDGYSGYPANNRWLLSPVFNAVYNIKKGLLHDNAGIFSTISMDASWGKIGKLVSNDQYSTGPQYRVDLGWTGEPNMSSYRGSGTLSRPYTNGWVGYDYPWAVSEKLNIGLNVGLLEDRLTMGFDWYSAKDEKQILPMPVASETGYTSAYESGMTVKNTGIDLSLTAKIIERPNGLSWTFNANGNYNKNKLAALPGGVNSVTIGDYYLEVGKAVDAFWVYENEGIYNSESEIPTVSGGGKLNFDGVDFSVGDAIWKDQNNDGVINSKDKVLKGHYMPTVSGGFGSNLTYKAFALDFQFYYALGRKVINQYASNRLNFINIEANNDINSVKEITFWQKPFDMDEYPLYNPWSSTTPFRADQDLFLQNASFLKLRSVMLEYNFAGIHWLQSKGVSNAKIYVTGTNLFTITPFKHGDPELSQYNGIYNGYGATIPRTYTVGVKLDL